MFEELTHGHLASMVQTALVRVGIASIDFEDQSLSIVEVIGQSPNGLLGLVMEAEGSRFPNYSESMSQICSRMR